MEKDIVQAIKNQFEYPEEVFCLFDNLLIREDRGRIIRCIIFLSDSDKSTAQAWIKKANEAKEAVIRFAEYDNREIRKFNFKYPIDKQKPYKNKRGPA